jgi:hypothetical protein
LAVDVTHRRPSRQGLARWSPQAINNRPSAPRSRGNTSRHGRAPHGTLHQACSFVDAVVSIKILNNSQKTITKSVFEPINDYKSAFCQPTDELNTGIHGKRLLSLARRHMKLRPRIVAEKNMG